MWQGQLSVAGRQATCNLQLATAANALIIFIRDSFVARTQRTLDMDMDVAEGGEVVGSGQRAVGGAGNKLGKKNQEEKRK